MASKRKSGIRDIVVNRRARYDYEILETFEAGIELKGSEVKSVKEGRVSIQEAYADIEDGEVFIFSMHISPYSRSGSFQHDPLRPKKLLLHKYEIKRLIGKVRERGLTLIPLKVYEKNGLIKVLLGLVKGKKKYEKRDTIKRRLIEREIERTLKYQKR